MIAIGVLMQIILLEVFFVKQGICQKYVCGFCDRMKSCKNFDNTKLDGENMVLAPADEDGKQSMSMTGKLILNYTIEKGHMFSMEVSKHTEMGKEDMYSCTMDICKSLQDKNAPWTPALQAMGISECPIEAKEYSCSDFSMDFSSMEDKMQQEFEGSYMVILKMHDDKMNSISCHELAFEIKAVEDN